MIQKGFYIDVNNKDLRENFKVEFLVVVLPSCARLQLFRETNLCVLKSTQIAS